jgi:ABC-type transport system involved in cytochrome bd biosynthesis fused ATPase/permease subunit
MWLIGRYTEQRARERWHGLRHLSTHFLDVVRGLPTLRAFDRADDQARAIADASERYRRATMGTLRVSFLSGSVLELAATLGVALVAVTAGVRLVGGGLGLQAGLTVLVLAPELYLPLRRLGAEFHASADGVAVAERLFALLDEPATARTGGVRASIATPRSAIPTTPRRRRAGCPPSRSRASAPATGRGSLRPSTACRCAWSPAGASRSSDRAAQARRPSSTCCCAFSTPRRAA